MGIPNLQKNSYQKQVRTPFPMLTEETSSRAIKSGDDVSSTVSFQRTRLYMVGRDYRKRWKEAICPPVRSNFIMLMLAGQERDEDNVPSD